MSGKHTEDTQIDPGATQSIEGEVPHANQKSQEGKELYILTTWENCSQSAFINLSFMCQMSCNNSNNYTWMRSPPNFTYRSLDQKSVSATLKKQSTILQV